MAFTDIQICNLALSRIGSRATIGSLSEATNEARACNMAYTLALESALVRFNWSFCAATARLVESGTAHTAWIKNTVYAIGAFRRPTAVNSYAYEATTGGTSHATTEPVWPTTAGATVADGTVTWTCREPITEWEYSYAMPSDCLKVRRILIGDEWTSEPYEIQGNKLLTNAADDKGLRIRYTSRPVDTTLFPASFVEAFAAKLASRLAVAMGTDANTRQAAEREWMSTQPGAEAVDAVQSRRNAKPDPEWIKARG